MRTYTHIVCVSVCVCGSVVLTNPVVSNDKEDDTPKLIATICKLQPAPPCRRKAIHFNPRLTGLNLSSTLICYIFCVIVFKLNFISIKVIPARSLGSHLAPLGLFGRWAVPGHLTSGSLSKGDPFGSSFLLLFHFFYFFWKLHL